MKQFIRVGSVLSLLVLLTAIATFAQSGFGTDVNIPFAFNVGDHSYEAGNYIVKFERRATGAATLSIQDTKTDELQTVLLNAGGDFSSAEIKLVFDKVEGQRYLTKVQTPVRTYALVRTKSERDSAKVRSEKAGQTGDAANLF
ncbi:MAG: hypothetical protein ABI481_07130 [Pyrinomonadaceae bacterium]